MKRKREKALAQRLQEAVHDNGLTEQQRLFCLNYVESHNAAQAYMKVYGCTYDAARVSASRLLTKANIQDEIKRLRGLLAQEYSIQADDYVRFLLKVAHANLGDFVEFPAGGVPVLRDSSGADTSLLEEVSRGPGRAFKVTLVNKRWAWERLDHFFGWSDARRENRLGDLRVVITRKMTDNAARGGRRK